MTLKKNRKKTYKRKTTKRQTYKRKTTRRKTTKRKTTKRKTTKRKTTKRKTTKRKTRVKLRGGAYAIKGELVGDKMSTDDKGQLPEGWFLFKPKGRNAAIEQFYYSEEDPTTHYPINQIDRIRPRMIDGGGLGPTSGPDEPTSGPGPTSGPPKPTSGSAKSLMRRAQEAMTKMPKMKMPDSPPWSSDSDPSGSGEEPDLLILEPPSVKPSLTDQPTQPTQLTPVPKPGEVDVDEHGNVFGNFTYNTKGDLISYTKTDASGTEKFTIRRGGGKGDVWDREILKMKWG